MATEKVINIKVDSKEAVKATDNVKKGMEETDVAAKNLDDTINSGAKSLDTFTKGGVSAMKGLVSGAKTAIGAMGTLKGAVMATGIGALVLVVTSLVSYFTKTERGANALNVIFGAVGAVVGKLTDVIIHLGEKLFEVFQNPKQALIDFGNAIKTNIQNRIEGMLEFIPALGKAISLALGGKFKEAGKVAADAVGKVGLGVENVTDKIGAAADAVVDFGKSLGAAADEGARLANIMNQVELAERELIVQRAKANKQIQEARFIADDLTKSTEERTEAILRAGKLEEEIAAKELATQRKKALALKQQADISESDKTVLKEIAEAEARVAELEQASIMRKKRLGMELKALANEEKARVEGFEKLIEDARKAEEAYQKFIMDGQKETIERINAANLLRVNSLREFSNQLNKIKGSSQTDREKELAQIESDSLEASRILISAGMGRSVQAEILEEEKRKALRKINEKYDKLDQQREMANNAKKLELAGQAFGALAKLSEAFANGDEKNAKKTFAITKALRLGEAVANTAAAIMNQLASTPGPAGFVQAGIAAVTGAAQIATIAKSKFEGGKTTAETPSIGGAASSASGGGGFTPNISFTGIGQNPLAGMFGQPMQAYVVGQQMNNANMLERRIRTSATFGG